MCPVALGEISTLLEDLISQLHYQVSQNQIIIQNIWEEMCLDNIIIYSNSPTQKFLVPFWPNLSCLRKCGSCSAKVALRDRVMSRGQFGGADIWPFNTSLKHWPRKILEP